MTAECAATTGSDVRSPRRQAGARLRLAIAAALTAVVAFAVAGCTGTTSNSAGSSATVAGTATSSGPSAAVNAGTQCPTSNTTPFAKTKFVAHAGLAFGAFHRYLWKPYRAGRFSAGMHGRTLALVKAGVAAAFVIHEVKLAEQDAQANPTLCRALVQPFSTVTSSVSSAVSSLRSGDAQPLQTADSAISDVESGAACNGATVQENQNATVPGA